MSRIFRRFAAHAADSGLANWMLRCAESRDSQCGDWLRILTYHRVDTPNRQPHLSNDIISTTPQNFQTQMEFLAENYRVITLEEVELAIRERTSLPPKSVVITFDDAYRDFREFALPVLTRLNLPSAVFVATGFVDNQHKQFWWDRVETTLARAPFNAALNTPWGKFCLADESSRSRLSRMIRKFLKSRPHDQAMQMVDEFCHAIPKSDSEPCNGVMSWDELQAVQATGLVTLGLHTHNHPILDQLSHQEIVDEISTCRDRLKAMVPGRIANVLAYPAGLINDSVVRSAKEAGVSLGLTTQRGINRMSQIDPLRIRRINVGLVSSLGLIRSQLITGARFVLS